MLAGRNDCTVPQALFNNFKDNLLPNFSRHWPETDKPVITGVFFLPFLKIGTTFASCHSTGASPDCQDHRKIIERGPAMMSASSPSTLGWIPSRCMDLYGSNSFNFNILNWGLAQFIQYYNYYNKYKQNKKKQWIHFVGIFPFYFHNVTPSAIA